MKIKLTVLLNLILLVVFIYAPLSAWEWPYATRLFVWAISVPTLLCLIAQLGIDLRRTNQPGTWENVLDTADLPVDRSIPPRIVFSRGINFLGWFLGLFVGIWLIGFQAALPLFMILYLAIQARSGWLLSLVMAGAVVAVQFVLFDRLLQIAWPKGVLISWFEKIIQG
ncbi:MAG: hypothetical protein ACE5I0_05340 [Candidatus Binatia bacterium]